MASCIRLMLWSTGFHLFLELRLQIEDEKLASYLDDFEAGIVDDVVMLGSISLQEVQEEERHLRDEHVAYLQQEAAAKRQRQEELLQREEAAKLRVAQYIKEHRENITRREVWLHILFWFYYYKQRSLKVFKASTFALCIFKIIH